jgi:hypothetical protein
VDFAARIAQLNARLEAGIRYGQITGYEAAPLRAQMYQLRSLYSRYSYNGLSGMERADLQSKIRDADQRIRLADSRYDGDRRYGYWGEGAYEGQGGPLEEIVCANGPCLAIGDFATGGLYAVPYEYHGRFIDTGRSYFRTDGTLIYEIDRVSNRVVSPACAGGRGAGFSCSLDGSGRAWIDAHTAVVQSGPWLLSG